MCGKNSLEVVFGVVSGKAGASVKFIVHEDGTLGESHSEIRSAHKIATTRRYVNVNYADGAFSYENGIPDWYAKYQKATEKTIKNIVDVALPNCVKKLAAAETAKEKKISDAIDSAEKSCVATKKAAFAPLAKLGGSLQ